MGVNEREQWQVAAFQETVSDCRLVDLGYHGLPYTWDNRQEGTRNVKVRIDRALGDNKFMELFGDSEVFHIPLAESDYCGILVEVRQRAVGTRRQNRRKPRPFRYENMWQQHGDYVDFVNRAWDPGIGTPDLGTVSDALSALQTSLKTWDREVFGSVKKQVKELREELEVERSGTLYRGPTDREREVMAKLSEVLAREEAMERQRSRIAWLREGDRNTAFFRAKARARQRTNRIKVLKDEDGRMFTEQEDLERLACEFYQRLFTAQEELDPSLVCKYVPRKVTPEMAAMLEKAYTEEEVESALFQMAPNKAPGGTASMRAFSKRIGSLLNPAWCPRCCGF